MIVASGWRAAVDALTNRPVDALRLTDRALPVPRPTRSVVVRDGQRAAAARLTNRPVDALLEALGPRAMALSLSVDYTRVIPGDIHRQTNQFSGEAGDVKSWVAYRLARRRARRAVRRARRHGRVTWTRDDLYDRN